MHSKEALYTHLSRIFSFPNDFGNNLDALWDVLNENDEPTTIEFLNVAEAEEHLGDYGEKLVTLLRKLEQENEYYMVRFR